MINTDLLDHITVTEWVYLGLTITMGAIGLAIFCKAMIPWRWIRVSAITTSLIIGFLAIPWGIHKQQPDNNAIKAQNSEVAKAEKLISKGAKEKYSIKETSLSFDAEDVRHAVDERMMHAPNITVVTTDGRRGNFGVKLDNESGEVTLVGNAGDINPKQLEK